MYSERALWEKQGHNPVGLTMAIIMILENFDKFFLMFVNSKNIYLLCNDLKLLFKKHYLPIVSSSSWINQHQ